MEHQGQEPPGASGARGGRGSGGFVVALAIYYCLYYFVFAGRVAEYVQDLFRHFAFVRRWF